MLRRITGHQRVLPSCLVLLWCCGLLASVAGAENAPTVKKDSPLDLELSPALFSSFCDDEYSLGVRFSVSYAGMRKVDWVNENAKDAGKDIAQRWRYMFKAEMKGSVAVEPEANPDPLYVQAEWGMRYLYTELLDFNAPIGEEPLSYYFAGSLMGRLESDQSQDNRLVSLGAHLNAISDHNSGFRGLIPDIGLHLEMARDFSSPAARRESAENETFTRFRATANRVVLLANYWKDPVWFLKSTKLIFDLRYYKEFERAEQWNDQGLDEAWYGALTFSLGDVFEIPHVSDLFLRLSAGRLPPNLEEATFITLGLTFY